MKITFLLMELIERVSANNGEPVFISSQEIAEWPPTFSQAIKLAGLITPTAPSKSTICPGCEQACTMPVTIMNQKNILHGFVFCDKRTDIDRIAISVDALEQSQISAYLIANLLTKLLELPSLATSTNSNRWELGVLKAKKHSSHLVLLTDQKLILSVSGHDIPIDELLSFEKGSLKIDRHKITCAIDNPATGSGDVESANDRRERLQQRVAHLKSKGHHNFIKLVAKEEGISTGRLHQILNRK